MYPNIYADLILFLHFLIVSFVTTLFFFIPIGYKYGWKWQKNKKIRLTHLILMIFVTFETIIGITCPLTSIENKLRGVFVTNSFIYYWITKIIFFQLPSSFFIVSYILCCAWTIFMWIRFPPESE